MSFSGDVATFILIVLGIHQFHMDDLFADAVCQSYDETDLSSDEDIKPADQGDLFDQASDVVDLDDDDNLDKILPGVVISDSDDVKPSRTPQKERAVLSKRSAPLNEPVRPAAKRKCTPGKVLKLNPIKMEDGKEIACVVVKKWRGPVAVPLWGQYRAAWRDVNFENKNWIVVSPCEFWIMMLVDAVTKKNCRNVAKSLVDIFRQEFQACLARARKADNLDGPVTDDECDDSPSSEMRLSSSTAAVVLQIKIGQFPVTTLNSKRRMALRVDAATAEFVSGWFLPLLKQVASGKAHLASTPVVAPSQDSPEDSQDFNMTKCVTPNIRDKVCWCPQRHTWKVYIKRPTDQKKPCPTPFSVNPDGDALAYATEKEEQYWLAVADWNRCDNSNRHRIPKRRLEVGVSTGPEANTTDNEEGTQTTTENEEGTANTTDK